MISRLEEYDKQNKVSRSKGHLSVVLFITRRAKSLKFPINSEKEKLLADGKGQISGLGKASVQAILRDHNITRTLAEEAGRTSRGSIDNMLRYIGFLNSLYSGGSLDLDEAEGYWIKRVHAFFAGKPFNFRLDASQSLSGVVRDLLQQAYKRQRDTGGGTMYAGAVLQHLVGAKLEFILPDKKIAHHGAFVADGPTDRPGDFIIKKFAIHVTTTPSESLMQKCKINIEDGYQPIIVTIAERMNACEALCEDQKLGGRIDIFEIAQFIATNIYEHSGFSQHKRKPTVEQFIQKYNKIVEECETDPSLKIALGHAKK